MSHSLVSEQTSQSLDPIAVLMDEHKDALIYLQRLENSVVSMDEDGFTREAFENLASAIRFFEGDFRKHDRKEEQILFPALEKYKPGITGEYRNEHRELWSMFHHLLSCVRDVEDGHLRGSSRHELVETAKRIVALLRSHMMNENLFLFKQAKEILSPEEYSDLTSKIAAVSH